MSAYRKSLRLPDTPAVRKFLQTQENFNQSVCLLITLFVRNCPDAPDLGAAYRKSLAENEAAAFAGVESCIPPLIPKEASPKKKVIASPEPPRRKEPPRPAVHPAPHLPAAGKQTDIPSCYL
ncbi:hypothetical protein ACTNCI_07630 [Mitsuokella jalaludinii]|uniref:hypothetical protein n=1 Tax=Mitsuokella jalaludinii TaxID=187979 RepID=UPI003F8CB0DA